MLGRAFALPGLTRRFLGRQRRMLIICECIQQESDGLHPLQIARRTGFSIVDVTRSLDQVPELFVRVPSRRSGYTRYRVVSALMQQPLEEIQAEIHRHARSERISTFIAGGLLVAVVVLVLSMMLPWTALSGRHVESADATRQVPGLQLEGVRGDLTLLPRGTALPNAQGTGTTATADTHTDESAYESAPQPPNDPFAALRDVDGSATDRWGDTDPAMGSLSADPDPDTQ